MEKNKICVWFGHKLELKKDKRTIWCNRCNRKVDYAKDIYVGNALLDFDKKRQARLIFTVIPILYCIGLLGYVGYQNFILNKGVGMVGIILVIPLFLCMSIPPITKQRYLG